MRVEFITQIVKPHSTLKDYSRNDMIIEMHIYWLKFLQ